MTFADRSIILADALSTRLAQRKELRAQSSEPILFPKLRIQFADFPYLHYSRRPEAANLGDLMRLWVRTQVCLCAQIFKGRRERT